jgi:hypothetical protein
MAVCRSPLGRLLNLRGAAPSVMSRGRAGGDLGKRREAEGGSPFALLFSRRSGTRGDPRRSEEIGDRPREIREIAGDRGQPPNPSRKAHYACWNRQFGEIDR